ncbi:hypothetical protein BLS_001254 [Venturia inaequalis]|uniref:Uncharacterized protein n=1 Tax=Venturia inaequalis TaxID=5025 RepID=A0A8H3VNI2_VENIN|nr:hypothetical protein BLS_001254 [Venturia inaequalis]KAE9991185.1 hypothetical protein EG327_000305 [Venturia inaequalis]RDI84516.1 hypothetical protein Vi05172_g5473 [Venturia inaequalis]
MCQNCGEYPTASGSSSDLHQTTLLTWAVPVDAAKLGASLEAYLEAKPFITQLLLCHSFGQGSNVPITKLPREIIDMVAEVLIAGQQTGPQERWAKMHRCSSGRCTRDDHYETGELDFAIEGAEEHLALEPDLLMNYESRQEWIDEFVESMCDQDDDMRGPDRCQFNREEWVKATNLTSTFSILDEVLRSDFGLAPHFARQSLTAPMIRWFEFNRNTDQDLSIANAYLTLPCRKDVHETNLRQVCVKYPDEAYACDTECSSFNVIDPEMLVLTEEKAKRFPRAMKCLGLVPHLNPCQIPSLDQGHPDPILNKAAKETKKKQEEGEANDIPKRTNPEDLKVAIQARLRDEENSKWPKLMTLTTSSCPQMSDLY